jgi:hypothetical protein
MRGGSRFDRGFSERRFHEVMLGLLGLFGFTLIWTRLA